MKHLVFFLVLNHFTKENIAGFFNYFLAVVWLLVLSLPRGAVIGWSVLKYLVFFLVFKPFC